MFLFQFKVVYAALNDSLFVISRALRGLMTANTWDSIYKGFSADTCPIKTEKTVSRAGTVLLDTLLKVK